MPPFTEASATAAAGRSPYQATLLEVVETFGTSLERVGLLSGFLKYRKALLDAGVVGFQWINGSFAEDVERVRLRAPQDIDLVNFISFTRSPDQTVLERLFLDREHVRQVYGVDTYVVELTINPHLLVRLSNYWYGLWSHTKTGHSWKGFLQVPLDYAQHDEAVEVIANRVEEFNGEADPE